MKERKALRIDDKVVNPLKKLNEYLQNGYVLLHSVVVSESITYFILEK